jgi:cytochrome P450
VLRGYTIPKGTHAGVAILGLHRNPRVWPNPLKFDPERWSVLCHRLSRSASDQREGICLCVHVRV